MPKRSPRIAAAKKHVLAAAKCLSTTTPHRSRKRKGTKRAKKRRHSKTPKRNAKGRFIKKR